MKGIIAIVFFTLINLSAQAYAMSTMERRYVLIKMYHLKNKHFVRRGYKSIFSIAKPRCEHKGVAEIDPGEMMVTIAISNFSFAQDRLQLIENTNDWSLEYAKPLPGGGWADNYVTTAKVYCSYPIQCIR